MNTKRDTHFAGFAEALFEDLDWNSINIDMERDGWEERWKTTIAQRAYDLVWGAICQQPYLNTIPNLSMREAMDLISDMPELLPDIKEAK